MCCAGWQRIFSGKRDKIAAFFLRPGILHLAPAREANQGCGMSNENGMTGVMQRNIRALLERRQQSERDKTRQQTLADTITRFTGSMTFVYLHLVVFGAWIVANLPWVPWPKFDPTFVILAMFASVEAIFLSTFVLISQNRMQTAA